MESLICLSCFFLLIVLAVLFLSIIIILAQLKSSNNYSQTEFTLDRQKEIK